MKIHKNIQLTESALNELKKIITNSIWSTEDTSQLIPILAWSVSGELIDGVTGVVKERYGSRYMTSFANIQFCNDGDYYIFLTPVGIIGIKLLKIFNILSEYRVNFVCKEFFVDEFDIKYK